MDANIDEILKIRNMNESEVKSIVLEKLRQMKKQEFEEWIKSKLGYQYSTDIHIVIMKYNNIGMGAYWKAFTAWMFERNGKETDTAVVVAFSFSKQIQKMVYDHHLEYPDRKIVLLSVEEILDGVTIEEKNRKIEHSRGIVVLQKNYKCRCNTAGTSFHKLQYKSDIRALFSLDRITY